jgi:hypothetical protein
LFDISLIPFNLALHKNNMGLTLKNYPTALSQDLLLQAKKNKVRECDETEKGHFIAYVDDGNESFDVSLTLSAGDEIIQHTCECNSAGAICRHRVALIVHVSEGKKIKSAVKVKKKGSKAETLLEEVDPNKLKEWIAGLISKNKEIELSFITYFSVKEQLTPTEVIRIMNDAVKAVIGNKKTIDLTQLKKLVELWSEMMSPVIADYLANVTSEKSFLNLHTMLETCIEFKFKVDFSSNRVSKFIDEALQKSVEPISKLQVEESWDKAITNFINHVPDGKNTVRMHYLQHLKNIIDASAGDRKNKIIDRLAKQFEKSKPDTLMNGTAYCKFIFEVTEQNDLFTKYSNLFKPIRFDNEYNQRLISLLVGNNDIDRAKRYCAEQMKYNFKEEYNIVYLIFLKQIALIQKNEDELLRVMTSLFPFTFNFDDYLFISERLPEEERKKWRTKMLTKSRNISAPYKTNAIRFYFQLADFEHNYRKMIDYIDSDTPYATVLKYFENMLRGDKNKLLEAILHKRDDYGWVLKNEYKETDVACFPALFELFEKYYTKDYLRMVIANAEKDRWHYRSNNFIVYVREQLGMPDR